MSPFEPKTSSYKLAQAIVFSQRIAQQEIQAYLGREVPDHLAAARRSEHWYQEVLRLCTEYHTFEDRRIEALTKQIADLIAILPTPIFIAQVEVEPEESHSRVHPVAADPEAKH